jgi:hypothetical protein
MPWKECNHMDERLRLVAKLLDGEKMAAVCREFGISRKTGYKIFNRYKNIFMVRPAGLEPATLCIEVRPNTCHKLLRSQAKFVDWCLLLYRVLSGVFKYHQVRIDNNSGNSADKAKNKGRP